MERWPSDASEEPTIWPHTKDDALATAAADTSETDAWAAYAAGPAPERRALAGLPVSLRDRLDMWRLIRRLARGK